MLHHALAFLVLLFLFLTILNDLPRLFPATAASPPSEQDVRPKEARPLRPRTPDDCSACRAEPMPFVPPAPAASPVPPWRALKSRRGAPKRINTQGFACPNPDCPYHNDTNAHPHAWVGDGPPGQAEPIQDLRCQACQRKFTVRRDPPLYRLKTSAGRVALILTALAEGLSVAGAVHTFDHAEATLTRWLQRAGGHAERLHGRLFRNLQLLQVQLDELRTTLRDKGQEVWIWIAWDARTKVIASAHLGPRTQLLAHALIHRLVQMLAPGSVPVFTSAGLDLYGYALTAHFGQWVQAAGRQKREGQVTAELLYGQVKKRYRRNKLVQVERRMRWGTLEAFTAKLKAQALGRVLNTAFVERVNLTMRRGIAALQRRSWSTTQTQRHLELHFQGWRGYYHFVRRHGSLRERLAEPRVRRGKRVPQTYQKQTPAMAVGVTDHRWTVTELLSIPMPS